ncbi:MAG: Crp/Fnr family transcriptional regulator [Leptothrix sp. (in: b-proteobacteria)]
MLASALTCLNGAGSYLSESAFSKSLLKTSSSPVETLDVYATGGQIPRPCAPRPRRRLAAPPPAPADPAPWQRVLGAPSLSLAESALLLGLAQRRAISAGESVLDCQAPARHLVLLLSGDVVLGSRSHDGVLRTERSVTGPVWLDNSAAWLGEPYAMEALALSDVVVAELPLAELEPRLAAYPQLIWRLCTNLAQRVHELTVASRNLLHNDASARFAQWLLQRCPTESGACELRLQERKRDIAQQLAMTPETLSRLMRSFEVRGAITVQGYTVQVHDVQALQRLVESGA